MTINVAQRAYTLGGGSTKVKGIIIEPKDPTQNDIGYPLKQIWFNSLTNANWQLCFFTSSLGVVYATWRAIGPVVVSTVDPTSADYQYPIGQLWSNTTTNNLWGLTSFPSSTMAQWESLTEQAGAGTVVTLEGNDDDPVPPDINGNILILGGTDGFLTTERTATNTLSILVAGTLPVNHGGTGHNSLTDHAILIGNGTSTVTQLGPSSNTGGPLLSGGASADPIFSTTFVISDAAGSFEQSAAILGSNLAGILENTLNSANSGALFGLSAAGTSAGDVYNLYSIGSSRSYALGVSNSNSQIFNLTTAGAATVNPSGGTTVFSYNFLADATATPTTPSFDFNVAQLQVSRDAVGQQIAIQCINTDKANSASSAGIISRVSGSAGSVHGDTFFSCVGNFDWTWGESASTPSAPVFKFGHGGTPSNFSNTFYSISTAGVIVVGQGTPITPAPNLINLQVASNAPSQVVTAAIINNDNTSTTSHAQLNIYAGGSSGGCPSLYLDAGTTGWDIGIANSVSGQPFRIVHGVASNPLTGAVVLQAATNGSVTVGINTSSVFAVNNTVSSSATAGSASALPLLPANYWEVVINGTLQKIPYYNT